MSGPFDQLAKSFLHREKLEAIAAGHIPPPVSVKIELTNVCNHDCHFCAYRRVVQASKNNDMLDTDRVLSLVDELAAGGVQGLMFTGGGEPLLHKGMGEILKRCRTRGMEHGLITNGSRLGKLSLDDLKGLRWIRFSVNAGTAEEYRDVHGVSRDDWSEVWRQIDRACAVTSFPGLAVGLSFVVTTRNLKSIAVAAKRARDAGANYAHFRPAFEGPHTQLDRQLTTDEQSQAVATFKELASLDSNSFRVYGIERRFDEIEEPVRRHIHCRSTPLVAYVLPTGDMSICTIVRTPDFNPQVPAPFLGNLKESSFFDVWGSDHHRTVIEGLSKSGCNRCHFAVYNHALEMIGDDQMHASFL